MHNSETSGHRICIYEHQQEVVENAVAVFGIKKLVGGFLLIEADDIDEAVVLASEWPGIRHGETIEIRPVRS